MAIHKQFEKIVEQQAYQPVVCAEGWFDPKTMHKIDTGGVVVSVRVNLANGGTKMNHYCKECYEKLKSEHDRWEKSILRLPI